MCLAIPIRVEELLADDMARVTLGGVSKTVSIALVEDVRIGDYVLIHVGFALTRLDPDEAKRTLALMHEAAVPGLPPSALTTGEDCRS
jgi:hydrogenase expression/formation protein HypC